MSASMVMRKVFGDGHEFWHGATGTAYKTAALALLGKGFTVDETADILGTLWAETSNEYGA